MAATETDRRFDIVRKENERAMFWLEAVADLEAAKVRVRELLSFWPGEYQIFDLSTRQLVLSTSTVAEVPAELPTSNAAAD